ncbi:hypothetical protein Drorol1_Dr00024764 [Drosera rotundifolia]
MLSPHHHRRHRRHLKTALTTMTPPLHETLISDPRQTSTIPISSNPGQQLGFLKRTSMSRMPGQIMADLDVAESFLGEFGAAVETLNSHATEIVSMSNQWEAMQRSFVVMKDLIASRVEETRKVESQLCDREKVIESKKNEVEYKEELISERFKEIEWMKNELEYKEKLIEKRFREIESKKNELECKEKLIEERFREIEMKKGELSCLERSMGERMKDLESEEKRFNGNSAGGVVVKTEPVAELAELELKEKRLNGNNPRGVVVKTEPDSEFGVGADDNDASLRLCVKMDGKALQVFLNDRFNEHESMGHQVYYALRLSKNPARLALDAMEGFFAPHLKKGDSEYDARVVRSSCLLLLDQLLKLKPVVERPVREEARVLAFQWKEKMRAEGESYIVVLGFLMLVAGYELSAEIDKSELGWLLHLIALKETRHSVSPRLNGQSGLSGEIEKKELGRLLRMVDKNLRAQLYQRLGFSALQG